MLNLYFKNMYVQKPFVTERFMDLSRAIEVYHRQNFEPNIDSKEMHSDRMKKITDALPEYSGWLKENLSFSNEKKLQTRLDEIIQKHPSTLGNNEPEFIANFTQTLRHTRNYYTHYGAPGKQVLLNSRQLAVFSSELKLVLDVIIMGEMGFDDDEICPVSDQLKNRLKKNWMKKNY